MSDYDDLFKKNDDDDLFFRNQKTPPKPDPNDTISDLAIEQKRSRSLLLVYVITMFMISIFTSVIVSMKYDDIAAVVDNIEILATPTITVAPSVDEDFPFEYQVSGTLKNNNQIALPVVYVEYYFYDAGGKVVATYYVEAKELAPGAEFAYEESALYATDFVSTDYAYGFDESAFFYVTANFIQMAIIGVAFLVIDKRGFKRDGKEFVKKPGKAVGETVIGFVLVYVAMILSGLLMTNVFGVEMVSENEATISSMFVNKPLNLIMLFLLLCIFTPIVEEIVFRKVLCNFFEARLGHLWAIILSGLIFGVMHVIAYGDFLQATPYVMMGWVFGYIYYRAKKNIFVPIAVHFINNFISYLIYFLPLLGYTLF